MRAVTAASSAPRGGPLRLSSLLALALAHLLVGCSGPDAAKPTLSADGDIGGGAPAQWTYIRAEPAHLTTGLADVAPAIVLDSSPGAPSASLIAAVEGLADLVAQAAGTKVATTNAWTPAADQYGPSTSRWAMTPSSALAEGWYRLGLPASMTAQPQVTIKIPGDVSNGYGSYFRVGSAPIVLGVDLCASTDLATLPKLIVRMSEKVRLPKGAAPPISIATEGNPSCVYFGPPELSEGNDVVELACTPAIQAAATATVTISAGFSSTTGVPLRSAAGENALTVTVPVTMVTSGCRTWSETEVPSF